MPSGSAGFPGAGVLIWFLFSWKFRTAMDNCAWLEPVRPDTAPNFEKAGITSDGGS